VQSIPIRVTSFEQHVAVKNLFFSYESNSSSPNVSFFVRIETKISLQTNYFLEFGSVSME